MKSLNKSLFNPIAFRKIALWLQGVRNKWEPHRELFGVFERKYVDYASYIAHQKSKFGLLTNGSATKPDGIDLVDYDRRFTKVLEARLANIEFIKPGTSVICLGARQGSEVKAFRARGCFAVGVDLNPGKESKYVLQGDFHKLEFPDGSVEVLYSNSFDHAYDLGLLLTEAKRVLKSDGLLIAELAVGSEESNRKNNGYWESKYWSHVHVLVQLIEIHGFKLSRKIEFDYPWPGVSCVFQRCLS
jgi:SAM-dependent methyltransferase